MRGSISRRHRLEALIQRLIDALDAQDAGTADLEPEDDDDGLTEESAQPLTLCPDRRRATRGRALAGGAP